MLKRTILKNIHCIHSIKPWCIMGFHQSSKNLKKKNMFYNQYIEQYRPKIYTGYVEDHLKDLQKKSVFNIDGEEPDFEKQLLKEASRRSYLYKRRRFLKKMGVKKKSSSELIFTPEQIEHIKFLHSDNPDLWTASYLATSFDVEPEDINVVLKKKIKVKPKTDSSEADRFYKQPSSSKELAPVDYRSLLNPVEEKEDNFQMNKKDEEIKQNRWFRNFEVKTKPSNEYVEFDEMDEEFAMEESLSEEHDELFDLEDENDEIDEDIEDELTEDTNDENMTSDDDDIMPNDDENDKQEDHSLKITTSDDVNFYDDEGRFLYKLT